MSRSSTVREFLLEGEQTFRLRYGELESLQEKTGVGPERLYQVMALGDWKPSTALEVLRYGLIGGGMAAEAADGLLKRALRTTGFVNLDYDEKSPGSHPGLVQLAMIILLAGFSGTPDEEIAPAGKPEGEGEATTSLSPTGS